MTESTKPPAHLPAGLILAALAVQAASPATGLSQDLVTLKNGNQLTGRIRSQEDSRIELLLPSGTVRLLRSEIRSIDGSRPFERYLEYGQALRRKEDFKQAAEVYLEGAAKYGADPKQKGPLLTGLLESGKGLLRARRFVESRSASRRLLEMDPKSPDGRKLLIISERMCRKIEKEISGFQHALSERPENDFARYHLGLRYESLGQTDRARQEYETILKRYPVDLKQFRGKIHLLRGFIGRHLVVSEESSAPPEAAETPRGTTSDRFGRHQSSRVAIYHYNQELAEEVAQVAEELIPKLEAEFEIAPDRRPYVIFIYRDEAEYIEATGRKGTAGYCEAARKIHLHQATPRLLRSVLPHELTHATLYRRFKGLPSWLDEGLAVRNEKGSGIYLDRVKEWMEAGTTFRFNELAKKRVLKLGAEERTVFYGQSYTLVDFLYQEHGGRDKLLRFMEAASSGKDADSTLKEIYELKGMEELEILWKSYMEL